MSFKLQEILPSKIIFILFLSRSQEHNTKCVLLFTLHLQREISSELSKVLNYKPFKGKNQTHHQ